MAKSPRRFASTYEVSLRRNRSRDAPRDSGNMASAYAHRPLGYSATFSSAPQRPDSPGVAHSFHELSKDKNLQRADVPGRGRNPRHRYSDRRGLGGALGVTATTGPGICLEAEAIGLAVMTEPPSISSTCSAAAVDRLADQDQVKPTCCRPSTAATASRRCGDRAAGPPTASTRPSGRPRASRSPTTRPGSSVR